MNTLQVYQVNHLPSVPTFAEKVSFLHTCYVRDHGSKVLTGTSDFPASGRQGVTRMLIHSEIS